MAKVFLLAQVRMLIVCAKTKHKTKPIVFAPPLPGYLQSEDRSPTEPALPEVSWTCLLNSAVYHKLCLLVYLNAVTPPSCSVLYSKHTELWGSEVSPSESPVYQTPLFCVSVFHFSSIPPCLQASSSPWKSCNGQRSLLFLVLFANTGLPSFGQLAIGLLILFIFPDHQLFPHWFFVLLLFLVP